MEQIVKLKTELSTVDDIFVDARWKPINHAAARAHGFYPCHLYHNVSFRLAAVVVERQRESQEFYLNANALFYLMKAVSSKKIEKSFVVLKERGFWRVVASAPIERVWQNLRDHAPFRGKHTDYWIIDSSFEIAKPELPF
jgi:hypothetical protein